jgi:hypothetical protein
MCGHQLAFDGTWSEAVTAAIDHSIACGMSTTVTRGGYGPVAVIPDVIALELLANGSVLPGGTLLERPDGRAVRVYIGVSSAP